MKPQVEITFKDIEHSDAVETRIRERVAKLLAMSENIRRCHVWVRVPHRRGRKPAAYVIDLSVQMTGSSLHVDHRPGDDTAHTDIYVAIRDAFNAMERQLRKWKEQHKGRPQTHETPLQGRIESLDGYAECGQIATTDGRLIYFHRNSVVNDGYDGLNEGDVVELSVDTRDAEEGPHARFVRPVSTLRFVNTPNTRV
ncbi:ribosome-associated translation inhibitor RaiA [Roseobacter sp. YSTF-M11]|uniref:Ribosome-associated translation inhibitor RaiA n=1 Tax=Roseobacter insulae TaxID=2859783 RepID=A0A9X1FST0_9RHOB|nr:ribosome-associated translation inhibitor RaiA [Roseobacter insulae]MBW4706802.1 ribosome-associated translation inhibitor RaiA [Roseobacter insulae]